MEVTDTSKQNISGGSPLKQYIPKDINTNTNYKAPPSNISNNNSNQYNGYSGQTTQNQVKYAEGQYNKQTYSGNELALTPGAQPQPTYTNNQQYRQQQYKSTRYSFDNNNNVAGNTSPYRNRYTYNPQQSSYNINSTINKKYSYDPGNVMASVDYNKNKYKYTGDVTPFQNSINQKREMTNPPTQLFAACVLGEHSHTPDKHKNMINNAAKIAGGITHTELVFFLKDGNYMCCTIHYGEEVEFLEKIYTGKEKWNLYRINVNQDQIATIFEFCLSQEGKRFDKIGMWTGFVPVLNWTTNMLKYLWYGNEERWFCSALVLRALQEALEEFRQYDARYISPTALNDLLSKHGKLVVDVFNKDLLKKDLQLFNTKNPAGTPYNV